MSNNLPADQRADRIAAFNLDLLPVPATFVVEQKVARK